MVKACGCVGFDFSLFHFQINVLIQFCLPLKQAYGRAFMVQSVVKCEINFIPYTNVKF